MEFFACEPFDIYWENNRYLGCINHIFCSVKNQEKNENAYRKIAMTISKSEP